MSESSEPNKEQNKPKFNVGDKVTGNETATRYVYTIPGWKGEVIENIGKGFMSVKGVPGYPTGPWTVHESSFDLVEPAEFVSEPTHIPVPPVPIDSDPVFEVGDYIKLGDYSKFEDYRVHAGQTARVLVTGLVNIAVKWKDGTTSSIYLDISRQER